VKCHVPVDLLRVEPRIWGDLETSQAISLFGAGVVALAALGGRLPLAGAVLLAGPLAGYALLELEGQPVRRLLPRILRHGLRRSLQPTDLDQTLWQEDVPATAMHQMRHVLHCLVGKMRGGR